MRYLRLYRAFVLNCLARTLEFRAQFFAGIIGYAIWTSVSLVFIGVVFGQVGAVRGWTRDQMWVLYGTYVVLESFCYGILGPNMWRFSGLVRDGGLDLILTKPVNAQFFVSTRYLDLNGWLNSILGVALIGIGLHRGGVSPSPLEWLTWALLLFCGFMLAYALWVLLRDDFDLGGQTRRHRRRFRPDDADGALSDPDLSGPNFNLFDHRFAGRVFDDVSHPGAVGPNRMANGRGGSGVGVAVRCGFGSVFSVRFAVLWLGEFVS